MRKTAAVMFIALAIILSGCSRDPMANEQGALILDAECMTAQPGPQKLVCIQTACETAVERSFLSTKCDAGIYVGEENTAREYGENFPDCALVQSSEELDQCLSDFCVNASPDSPEKKTCETGLYKDYFTQD